MSQTQDPIPPHPLIPALYRDHDEKREWLRAIFNETASDYDRMEAWLSLGSGGRYRREALERAGLSKGMLVADVACGTGLVSREAIKLAGSPTLVTGIDPSDGMLDRARAGLGIGTVIGTAESLPLMEGSVDFLVMGYALRHVQDVKAAFGEFHRVLKPGGRGSVLEITRPRSVLGRALLRAYMGSMSRLYRLTHPVARRTPELWTYYWETIDRCITPDRVVEALRVAGFKDVRHRRLFGVFSEYTMTR